MDTLSNFFNQKNFRVPNYQRDYDWEPRHFEELWDDVVESADSNTSHYLGTIILSKTDRQDMFSIVDGQQRLTTLYMLMKVLIDNIEDIEFKSHLRYVYLSVTEKKLALHNRNDQFFTDMLEGKQPQATSIGQKKLLSVFELLNRKVLDLVALGEVGTIRTYAATIDRFELLTYLESSDGRAIRIFQTVNDRGKKLSEIDKVKSLLIYYSNRFIDGDLDNWINDQFGEIYSSYNDIKDLVARPEFSITLLKDKDFTEDSILRYHFLSFPSDYWDYKANIEYVLSYFLKPHLKSIRANKAGLREFINNYVADLHDFFSALLELISRIRLDAEYYKLFCILNPSTNLYPLLIRMHMKNLLCQHVPNNEALTFLNILSIIDLRVYKIRGTEPQRDILYLSYTIEQHTQSSLCDVLLGFLNRFSNDLDFQNRLMNESIYGNRGLRYIFIEQCESIRQSPNSMSYTVEELIQQNIAEPTIDHIYCQTAQPDYPQKGFTDLSDYQAMNDRFGNLIHLSKRMNSACQDVSVDRKVKDPNFYGSSTYENVRLFAKKFSVNSFKRAELEDRTRELTEFCLRRFPTWNTTDQATAIFITTEE